jgi:hypothetical protein
VTTTHNACALIKEEPDHHVPRRRLPSRSSSCPALWPGFAWWIRALRSIRCTGGQRIRCGVRTGRRALRVQAGGARQPHPHLLAHEFHMNGFNWEYFGLREDRGYRDAQKTPRSQNPPRYGVPQRARASGHPQVPASRRDPLLDPLQASGSFPDWARATPARRRPGG